MLIHEVQTDERTMEMLIRLSKDWEDENSCYGYRANGKADIEGNRIFLAEENGTAVGYLFGNLRQSQNMKSIMPEGTPFFEVEELYVVPERRSQGIGGQLFRHAESVVAPEADYTVLSTATKNWKAVFHFYLDELGMEFWSARLYKRI